ncbi:HAD-like domain-containing protein [Xylaria nigripes]|nr:HAD-like domain-containing protein [Xylaria nigripes]
MSMGLKLVWRRSRSYHYNIGRGYTRLIRNYSSASSSSAIETETSLTATAEQQNHQAPDTVSITPAGRTQYVPTNAPPVSPFAPNSVNYNNLVQLNHPLYGFLRGQASAMSSFWPLSSSDQFTRPGHGTPSLSSASPSLERSGRDMISPPSEASGGVPDPTPDYLTLASHPPFLLPRPRNMLVVIDLNGTLLYRPKRHHPTSFVERPFARAFLSYCVNTFKVVIWSSAQPKNVQNMCAQLLTPEDRAKLVAVWARDSFGLCKSDYKRRVLCYKRLSALWNDPVVAASHPLAEHGAKWSQLNTVLVDDSFEKARSEPYNLIQIPEFQGNAQEPGFVLPQVHDYLNECSQQSNASAYMKNQPFQADPEFTLSL